MELVIEGLWKTIPAELNHFTTYAGLISSALELARLIQTEKRDLEAIHAHHAVQVERIRRPMLEAPEG